MRSIASATLSCCESEIYIIKGKEKGCELRNVLDPHSNKRSKTCDWKVYDVLDDTNEHINHIIIILRRLICSQKPRHHHSVHILLRYYYQRLFDPAPIPEPEEAPQ